MKTVDIKINGHLGKLFVRKTRYKCNVSYVLKYNCFYILEV